MKQNLAQALMTRETRVRHAPAPRSLSGVELAEHNWMLVGDEFLLRAGGEHRFHYRKGEGVKIERGPGADPACEELFLKGTMHAAIASLNGLYPIHASAVEHDGRVFAFTAPAGGGKSTLAAALSARGLPLFCDDTLILDLSDPGIVQCLPGHKRLKLWPDALVLTGARAGGRVWPEETKRYAEPAATSASGVLPLAELCFLEAGEPMAFHQITGGERIVRLQDDHYTVRLHLAANRPDCAERFAQLAHLALSMRMTRFVRPLGIERFGEAVAMAEAHIRGATGKG